MGWIRIIRPILVGQMVFVASDEVGYPVAVTNWVPELSRDKKLEQYAIRAKEFSQALDKGLLAATDSE